MLTPLLSQASYSVLKQRIGEGMPSYTPLGPVYYDEAHKEIKSRMEAFYADAITINLAYWQEGYTDTRFETGDQTVFNDYYGNLPVTRRRNFSFNRIRRIVEMIQGYQRQNRKSFIVVPIENGDAETADQFTKIMLWLCKSDRVLETISDAFHGSLVTGINFLQVWLDYRNDPVNGNIRVDQRHYNTVIVDPFFKKTDLSDCNGIWTRSFLTKSEIVSLLPQHVDEVMGLYCGKNNDGKFQFMPESYNYSMRNLLIYDEFYYRDYRKQKLLVDTKSGETMEWRSDDKDRLDEYLRNFPTIELIEQDIPTVRLAISVQGKVIYDGPNPLGIDRYNFVPVLSYYSPQSPDYGSRVQGVVRGLRDAQYLYNRRKIIELDILESQLGSGYKYKEDSLVNPKDVFMTGQGKGIAVKKTANIEDVQQIQPPQIPSSMMEISAQLAKEVEEISGVNSELLGSAQDDKAGILSMLRQGAGLVTLRSLFDNLDTAQKLLGQIILETIQVNWTPGKVKKVLEGQEPTPQFYNKAFGVYHAAVEDGLNTTTQQQMQFAQMLNLRQAGIPISDQDLIEASTIQGKKKIIENLLSAQQQQQQQQQMKMQQEMQQQQATIDMAQAKASADRGLAIERASRVGENAALAEDRRADAVKNQDMALLNKVRALKELEDIDLQHIERLVSMANVLKGQSSEQEKLDATMTETPNM